jgi:hypothetical protein
LRFLKPLKVMRNCNVGWKTWSSSIWNPHTEWYLEDMLFIGDDINEITERLSFRHYKGKAWCPTRRATVAFMQERAWKILGRRCALVQHGARTEKRISRQSVWTLYVTPVKLVTLVTDFKGVGLWKLIQVPTFAGPAHDPNHLHTSFKSPRKSQIYYLYMFLLFMLWRKIPTNNILCITTSNVRGMTNLFVLGQKDLGNGFELHVVCTYERQ